MVQKIKIKNKPEITNKPKRTREIKQKDKDTPEHALNLANVAKNSKDTLSAAV